jgi:hypothetical protein
MGFDLNVVLGPSAFRILIARRTSPPNERPNLKLASATGLSKLPPAIYRSETRCSFEHAPRSRYLIPLCAASCRADSRIRDPC